MHNVALLAILEAKAGKQEELAAFLKSALPLAVQEPATVSWFHFGWTPLASAFSIHLPMSLAETLI